MKRLGGLWEELTSFENLLLAYRKARRGKRSRTDVALFTLGLERELLDLRRSLLNGDYRPGTYTQFRIYERKARIISKAPFRDRVVHHAILNLIEVPIDRGFISDTYACRKGRGVHAAVDRYQRWANRYCYCLKLDVSRFFPSIDHELLKAKITRKIKDRSVLTLIDRIIDSSPPAIAGEPRYYPGDDLFTPFERKCGLPIGNLTSQFFANLYLDGLDHYVKQTLREPAYLRYVDDLVLLGDDKARLHDRREAITDFLATERLSLRPGATLLEKTARGVDILGFRVYPHKRRLRAENGYRYRRRLKQLAEQYAVGEIDFLKAQQSIRSWIGHACHADSAGLRRDVIGSVVFQRGRAS